LKTKGIIFVSLLGHYGIKKDMDWALSNSDTFIPQPEALEPKGTGKKKKKMSWPFIAYDHTAGMIPRIMKFFPLLIIVLTLPFTLCADLISWWAFEGNTNDQAPSANHGSIEGTGTTFVSDTPSTTGQAISFDGNGRVRITHSPSLAINDNLTVSFWMKAVQGQPGGYTRPMSKGGSPGWEFQQAGAGNELDYRVDTSAGANQVRGNMAGVFDNNWHHISITLSSAGQGISYVDGTAIATQTFSFGAGFSNSADFTIGSRNNGGNSYDGIIDDVAIFDQVLMADQIASLADFSRNPGNVLIPEPQTATLLLLGIVLLRAFKNCGGARTRTTPASTS
jgi:hypothetical protein